MQWITIFGSEKCYRWHFSEDTSFGAFTLTALVSTGFAFAPAPSPPDGSGTKPSLKALGNGRPPFRKVAL